MAKYIATQVEPEMQKSPLMMDGADDFRMQEVCLIDHCSYPHSGGNKELINMMYEFDRYDTYKDIIKDSHTEDEAIDGIIADFSSHNPWYDVSKYKPSRKLDLWKQAIEANDEAKPDEPFPKILTCMTGREYKEVRINGSRQSKWARLFCPTDWSDDDIRRFEAEYFNTGSEWMVAPADDTDDTVSVYATAYDDDGLKAEIAGYLDDARPDDIGLRVFTGYQRIPQYRIA